jgi:2-(1,2-epoxy-1,2-dihydrophenyl)acetyl-CoA isomerase
MTTMTHQGPVAFERTGDIGVVTLNRPDVLNAVNFEMGEALIDRLERLRSDDSLRAVVMTGAGRAFSSGGDVGAMKRSVDAGRPSLFMHRLIRMLNVVVSGLRSLPRPVVAAVPGITTGGGLDICLACDIRIASEKAGFKAAYTGIGLVPAGGGSYLLCSAVGPARALEFFLKNDVVRAEEAAKMGIVHRVVAHDRLMDEALAVARRLADLNPAATAGTKMLVNDAAAGSAMEAALAREASLQRAIVEERTAFSEGLRAFAEKRPPRFS